MANFYPNIVNSNSIIPAHKIDNISMFKNPSVINRFSDGNKQMIVINKNPIGQIISMSYDKLNDSNVKILSDFYNLVGGQSVSWYFPLKFTRYKGQWIFSDRIKITPVVSNLTRGVYNVNVSVMQIDY